MARIVLADDGIEFDGATPHNRPLGGAESSVVFLVQELAKRGHDVHVRNKCAAAVRHEGVDWAPIQTADRNLGLPEDADLYTKDRNGNVIRALSLVPDEVRGLIDQSQNFYIEDLADHTAGRSITRPQIELIAARVSALNECYY